MDFDFEKEIGTEAELDKAPDEPKEPPETEAMQTEEGAHDEESIAAPEGKEAQTTEGGAEGEEEAGPSVSVDELRKLMNELAALRARAAVEGQAVSATAATQQPKPVQPEKPAVAEAQRTPVRFLTDEEAEELLDNPSKLNDVLTRVYNQALEDSFRTLPVVVNKMIQTQMTMQQLVTDFYRQHEDLAQYRDFVALVCQELESKPENAGKPYDKLLEETAMEARKRLGLIKKTKAANAAKSAPIPEPRGARRSTASPMSDIEREIIELADL